MEETQLSNKQKSLVDIDGSSYEKVLNKLRARGGGVSEFQSSSSLQHSIPEVSFCKANRFQHDYKSQTDFNYSIPSEFDKKQIKGTSFGYGEKYITPEYVIRNAKTNPGPNLYFRNTFNVFPETTGKLPSNPIRQSNWSQSHRFIDAQELIAAQVPAPNNYNQLHQFGQSKAKFSFGLRTKELTPFQACVPSPNEYNQSIKFVSPNRFSGAGLGYGKKLEFGSNEMIPGPGQYDLPSVFKKSASSMMALNTRNVKQIQK